MHPPCCGNLVPLREGGRVRSHRPRSGFRNGPSAITASMTDVILPVLNEADALPWVLGRMPEGFRPIVVDNGSTDGSGAIAARLGAVVVPAAVAGSVRRASPASRPPPTTSWRSWTATGPSTRASFPGRRSLIGGRRRPRARCPIGRSGSVADPRPPREPCDRRGGSAQDGTRRSPTSARCGLPDETRSLGLNILDRRFGWPFEMVLRAHAGRLADPRGASGLSATRRVAPR